MKGLDATESKVNFSYCLVDDTGIEPVFPCFSLRVENDFTLNLSVNQSLNVGSSPYT